MLYDEKTEQLREQLCDKAHKDIFWVANEFARQINQRYHRTITDWSCHSTFDSHDAKHDLFHPLHLKQRKVSIDVSRLEWSDAVELAWELESEWNKRVDILDEREGVIDTYFDYDHDAWERYYDLFLDFRRQQLEDMAEIVERWIDGTEDLIWDLDKDELLEELCLEVAA